MLLGLLFEFEDSGEINELIQLVEFHLKIVMLKYAQFNIIENKSINFLLGLNKVQNDAE